MTADPKAMTRHIRMRPGMYLGDTGVMGLHRLAFELIDYSLASISSGRGERISVRISADRSVTVTDDGLPIPVERHPNAEVATLEWVMTISNGVEVRHGQRRFLNGCHGVGTRTVTALSDWAEATVCCNGRRYQQRYEKGIPVGDVCDIGPAGDGVSTTITFHPDPEIFGDRAVAGDLIEAELQELAFLEKSLVIEFADERMGREETFHYPHGLADFVAHLNYGTIVLHPTVHFEQTIDDMSVEVAFQYTTGNDEQIRCYANRWYNRLGGTHRHGFEAALARSLSKHLGSTAHVTNSSTPERGLTAVVRIKLAEPQFESQSRLKLNNPEVRNFVHIATEPEFDRFLTRNPAVVRRLVER
jgi:DNA gyrase subunit B